jgi:hypothetical protein
VRRWPDLDFHAVENVHPEPGFAGAIDMPVKKLLR